MRRGSYVASGGALVTMGLAVVTNYVTASLPGWAENPWIVWGVFGVLVVTALLLHLWGRRLDADAGGPPGRPVPVPQVVSRAAASLASPALHRPVRGREDVVAGLERLLERAPSGGRFAVVAGVGGMGKTTVAAALAERARAKGVPVFWIRWRDEASLAEQMVQTALACGLPEESLEAARAGRVGLADTVWGHLGRSRRWLIVLDNLDDPDTLTTPASGPLSEHRGWIRPAATGLLLVTSRVTDPTVWGGSATLVRLTPLPEQDGAQVLLDTSPGAGTTGEAQLLADRLGGLPLALHAVGRYLAAPAGRHRTFTAYRQALDTELAGLLGAEHPRATDPDVARTVVRHTWDLSLDQLTHDGTTLARPLLRLLSLLAPAPIPLSFLTPELLTRATGLPATTVTVEAAVNGLHTYGLLEAAVGAGGEPTPGLAVLHPLIREITALTFTETTADTATWHHALARHTTATIRTLTEDAPAGRSAARRLSPHALAVGTLPGNTEDRSLCAQLAALARLLADQGDPLGALLIRRHVAATQARLLGPDHPDTLTSRSDVARVLGRLGRYREAVDLRRQVLGDLDRVLGPDHLDTLISRNDLAHTLGSLGRYREAVDLLEQVLGDLDRVLGPDHPHTLTSRNNLASVLGSLGRYQEEADLHQQILDDRERVLGPDHPALFASRNNLASALVNLGRYQEAVDLLQQVVSDLDRVLGPDHPDTLAVRNNLAHTVDSLGRHQEAVDLHQQVLDDRERVLGPDHPDTLTSRNNLALAWGSLGRHQEEADLHRRVLDDLDRVLGPDHPHTLTSRGNLAGALGRLGLHQEAVALRRQVLDGRERVLGPDHPDTLVGRDNLVAAQAALERSGGRRAERAIRRLASRWR
ncbi:FxSxx-COOH system tetratricopeptide repeat protein [Streptomyces sp. NPDC056503]|uniref:FxSxx-COOH system tetratricopeptide repeat protein n=1 Tax=Streptomyces sp. NPDC056503 TaxID=3345842 RepID=UPI0036A4F97F